MLSENTRNWLLGLEMEALETGKTSIEEVTSEAVSDEEKAAFNSGLASLKKAKEALGDDFKNVTIDVGYDY